MIKQKEQKVWVGYKVFLPCLFVFRIKTCLGEHMLGVRENEKMWKSSTRRYHKNRGQMKERRVCLMSFCVRFIILGGNCRFVNWICANSFFIFLSLAWLKITSGMIIGMNVTARVQQCLLSYFLCSYTDSLLHRRSALPPFLTRPYFTLTVIVAPPGPNTL